MISVQNASCGYGGKAILSDINFSFQAGEAVCVLGANGIGKTTLFKSLLGLIPFVDGTITIEGEAIKMLPKRTLAKKVAYVPQSSLFAYQHPVEEVIVMGRAQYIKPFDTPSEKDYAIVETVMNQLKISYLLGMSYSKLSGGEKQLVLIARAIVQGASYILLDEPASNLDLANQSLLMQTINSLKKQGVGVLMISHSPSHAFSCCEKTLMIYHDGKSECGNTREMVTTERLKRVYSANVEIIQGLNASGDLVHTYWLQ